MNKIDTGRPEYLSKAETAKLVRAALKRAFPEHTFSVTISGSSLSVTWYDGPSAKEVDEIVHGYESQGFDGMIDMAYYKTSWLEPDGSAHLAYTPGTDGSRGVYPEAIGSPRSPGARLVSFGANYVITQRSLTDEAKAVMAAAVEADTGQPFDMQGRYWNEWGSDLLHRKANVTSFPPCTFVWTVYRYELVTGGNVKIALAEGLPTRTAAERLAKELEKAGNPRGFRHVEAHRPEETT